MILESRNRLLVYTLPVESNIVKKKLHVKILTMTFYYRSNIKLCIEEGIKFTYSSLYINSAILKHNGCYCGKQNTQ
jgi:hypothetical protein